MALSKSCNYDFLWCLEIPKFLKNTFKEIYWSRGLTCRKYVIDFWYFICFSPSCFVFYNMYLLLPKPSHTWNIHGFDMLIFIMILSCLLSNVLSLITSKTIVAFFIVCLVYFYYMFSICFFLPQFTPTAFTIFNMIVFLMTFGAKIMKYLPTNYSF